MLRQIIKFVNNLMPKSYRNEDGKVEWWSWPFDLSPDKDEQKPQFVQQPEYKEAEGARAKWWDTLQQWGNDPNYGAISPDWSNIWEGVQRRVKEYYQGGPLTTGVKDKLRANLARRNMSENPASDYLMTAMDAQQGRDLMDADVKMGEQKTALTEQGRNTWLSSLSNLSQQKPSGTWWQQQQQNPGITELMNLVTGVGGAVAGYGMQSSLANQQNSWLEKIMNQNNQPQISQTKLTW